MNEQQLTDAQTQYEQGGPESGPPAPELIETFYEYDNDDIFLNWYGDAVADHDDDKLKQIKAHMRCIRTFRDNAIWHGKKGKFLDAMEAHNSLQRYHAEFGKLMFDLINDYMEKASENCK